MTHNTDVTKFTDSVEATEFMETLQDMLSDPRLMDWVKSTDYNYGSTLEGIITQIRDDYNNLFDQICELE